MTKKIFSLVLISLFSFVSCGSDEAKTDYDVVIIGAGGGGLAASARLALKGKKILLIEQHKKVGGYMGSFMRGDYKFEISLHSFDGLDPEKGMNVQVFKDLGIDKKTKPIKMDPMYKVIYPSFEMTVPADHLEYKKVLIKQFPHEEEGINDFYDTLDRIGNTMDAGLKLTRGSALGGLWDMITSPRSVGTMMWYMNSTMGEFISDFFTDPKLISAMTALTGMLGDGPDNISGLVFCAMWNSYHKGGYTYFEGGSESLANALESVIKENGGEILLNTLVTKILVEDGTAVGVQTKEGKTIRSSYVVSNADGYNTFMTLVGKENLDEDFVEEIENMEVGAATYNIYLGVKKDYNKYFAGTSHQIIVNEFDDYREIFKPMKEGNVDKIQFGIANYSNLESDLAPKGKNVLSIVTLMPYDWNDGWNESKGYDAYKKLKNDVAKKIIKRVEKILPGLSANIEEIEVATPRTNVHYTLNHKGSIYGWSNNMEQSMLKRLSQETPIEGLYLAGAWTFPAGGQSAVLMSGLTTADMIISEMD